MAFRRRTSSSALSAASRLVSAAALAGPCSSQHSGFQLCIHKHAQQLSDTISCVVLEESELTPALPVPGKQWQYLICSPQLSQKHSSCGLPPAALLEWRCLVLRMTSLSTVCQCVTTQQGLTASSCACSRRACSSRGGPSSLTLRSVWTTWLACGAGLRGGPSWAAPSVSMGAGPS